MSTKCINHPGRDSVIALYQKNYCSECRQGMLAARILVKKHCEPRTCFITYAKANTWERIVGTGCAHFVSHQLGISASSGNFKCLAGYFTRVPDLVRITEPVALKDLQLNDIFVNLDINHTGLVTKIEKVQDGTDKITIKHASSGQDIVAENDFATYFKKSGTFRRYVKKIA